MKRLLITAVILTALVALAKSAWIANLTSTAGASVNTVIALSRAEKPIWAGVRCDGTAHAQTGTAYVDGGGVTAGANDPLIYANVPEQNFELLPGENGVAVACDDGGTCLCRVSRLTEF